jgi:hypothetical protein
MHYMRREVYPHGAEHTDVRLPEWRKPPSLCAMKPSVICGAPVWWRSSSSERGRALNTRWPGDAVAG